MDKYSPHGIALECGAALTSPTAHRKVQPFYSLPPPQRPLALAVPSSARDFTFADNVQIRSISDLSHKGASSALSLSVSQQFTHKLLTSARGPLMSTGHTSKSVDEQQHRLAAAGTTNRYRAPSPATTTSMTSSSCSAGVRRL
ncbi:unnamed protein product [Anisakis simplex]|uniref:Uncharacterized protein n=1 Tax=Anisakis simplex TaxID=6269 RepID=A0A0M3J797_ANISI|nr:unnamed protein product [Anisakis simplex]